MSAIDDRICNWTFRASCNQIVEITSLQVFNETASDRLFVSKLIAWFIIV